MRFKRNYARFVRRIAKPNSRYRHFGQTDLQSKFRSSATMLSATFALKRVFERASRAIAPAARTGLQNPTVGTGVLDRRTFGPSFVALQPCLLPLLL